MSRGEELLREAVRYGRERILDHLFPAIVDGLKRVERGELTLHYVRKVLHEEFVRIEERYLRNLAAMAREAQGHDNQQPKGGV